MGSKEEFTITRMEPWMLANAAAITVAEYGGDLESAEKVFRERFFDSKSAERSLAVAALDGQRVIGTQTYLYWPYRYQDRTCYSLQSGRTLVDKDYRRKGLFYQMLRFGTQVLSERNIDFCTGFPVIESLGGFLKEGWSHVGTCRWFIRPLRMGNILRRNRSSIPVGPIGNLESSEAMDQIASSERVFDDRGFGLVIDSNYVDRTYRNSGSDFQFFSIKIGSQSVLFPCKLDTSFGFNLLIIGDILVKGSASKSLVGRSISSFIKQVRSIGTIDALGVAINPKRKKLLSLLLYNRFIPTPKKIFFIVKNIRSTTEISKASLNFSNWNLLNGDIDTW